MLRQLCKDASDSVLIENNGVATEWDCNPFLSDSIVTAWKQSLGQGNIFRILSRILSTKGVCLSACWDTTPVPWDQAGTPRDQAGIPSQDQADTPLDQAGTLLPPRTRQAPPWDQPPRS